MSAPDPSSPPSKSASLILDFLKDLYSDEVIVMLQFMQCVQYWSLSKIALSNDVQGKDK